MAARSFRIFSRPPLRGRPCVDLSASRVAAEGGPLFLRTTGESFSAVPRLMLSAGFRDGRRMSETLHGSIPEMIFWYRRVNGLSACALTVCTSTCSTCLVFIHNCLCSIAKFVKVNKNNEASECDDQLTHFSFLCSVKYIFIYSSFYFCTSYGINFISMW